MTVDENFGPIASVWLVRPGIRTKKMLNAHGLCGPSGKVFAYPSEAGLVVKIPAARADDVVASEHAHKLTSGQRVLREWVVVEPSRAVEWPGLVEEAYGYVERPSS